MIIKLVVTLTLITTVTSEYCNYESAIASFKQPTYNFSINILCRVAEETDYHFAFSPIATWMELIALAEGAQGETAREIQKVTKHLTNPCFLRKYFQVLDVLQSNINSLSKRSSVIVINKLINIINQYRRIIHKNKISKIVSLNFGNVERAAAKVNRLIEKDTSGAITQAVYHDDFNNSVLFLSNNGYFKSEWLFPFDPVYTSEETFFSENNIEIGMVKMMSQLNYFKLIEVPKINAQVLELPLNTRRRLSMLIVLPTKGTIKENLFYSFRYITLRTIFNLNEHSNKLVSVKVPRFLVETELPNLAELLYDMGVKKMFYPEQSNFDGMSNTKKLYVSLISQIANIEVTEKGATAGHTADFIVDAKNISEFTANRPFAYFIVDKVSEVILFAGMYSKPEIY